MDRSTKIVKKLLALFLVVLMSINSFAAIVGDNDGAAFITKAEFESLKNDFQTQMNRYNSSLDEKITGTIATYLSGIQVAKTTYQKSTLEVAGQTYNNVYRKSYVFAGNDNNTLLRRYGYESSQFVNPGDYWNQPPGLYARLQLDLTLNNRFGDRTYSGLGIASGNDTFRANLEWYSELTDNAGNAIGDPTGSAGIIFLADNNNYVNDYKLNAIMNGIGNYLGYRVINKNDLMQEIFVHDTTHHTLITLKDIVGAGGTNGMGYSTRALGANNFFDLSIWYDGLSVSETSTPGTGQTYTGISFLPAPGVTRYIMRYRTTTYPYNGSRNSFNGYTDANFWRNNHFHFNESRFGSAYAWCMPFAHNITDRTVPVFTKWPAWDNVCFYDINTQNVGTLYSSTDREFYDISNTHKWLIKINAKPYVYHNSSIGKAMANGYETDVADYVDFDGMLQHWATNPMKDFRLLKNGNINNALSVDCYYAKAPALTSEFSNQGTITWVAKVQQEDDVRFPSGNRANWGITRIYFANTSMDDLAIDGSNVTVSHTKKFKYKKYGTTNAYVDSSSEVVNGTTCYFAELDHDTYYEFNMEVDKNETVHYMVCDMDHLADYCLEVYEHPDEQIKFVG